MQWQLDHLELRAYFGVNFMMGIKKLPNHRCYWRKTCSFLFCKMILFVMLRRQYVDITRYIHVVEEKDMIMDKKAPNYDKLGKMRWLLHKIKDRCKL